MGSVSFRVHVKLLHPTVWKRSESELDNTASMGDIYSVKEDSAGLDMWYEWITSAYLDRLCTGRFRGLREVQVVRTHKLVEEHSQQGLVKDGNHLRGSRGDSSKQISMTSKCGPMHPLWCRLNQGQKRSLYGMQLNCWLHLCSVWLLSSRMLANTFHL